MDRVVERSLQLEVMLDEQRRLMGISNKKLVELERRILDEQAAFDKMEELYLQAEKGHRLYKRLFHKNAKFLRTTFDRLESSSWENEQELKIYFKTYGDHTKTCALLQGASFTECNCGFERAQAVIEVRKLDPLG